METKIKIIFGEYEMNVTNLPYSFDEFISMCYEFENFDINKYSFVFSNLLIKFNFDNSTEYQRVFTELRKKNNFQAKITIVERKQNNKQTSTNRNQYSNFNFYQNNFSNQQNDKTDIEYKNKIKTLEENINKKEKDYNILFNNLNEINNENIKLKNNLNENNNKLENALNIINEKNNMIKQYEINLEKLKKELEKKNQLENLNKKKENNIENENILNQNISNIKFLIQKVIDNQNNSFLDIKNRDETIINEIKSLKLEKNNQNIEQESIQENNQKISRLNIQISNLLQQNESLKDAINKFQNINTLNFENSSLKEKINTLNNENISLKQNINTLNNENETLKQNMNALNNKNESLNENINSLNIENISLKGNINSLNNENISLKKNNSQIQLFIKKNELLNNEIKKLRIDNQKIELSKNLLQENEALKTENAKLNNIIKDKKNIENENFQLKKSVDTIKQENIKLKNDIKKINENNNNNKKIQTMHSGIKCNLCYKMPIIGIRYKCSKCENFNLCENCEEKNYKRKIHKHYFIKLRDIEEKNDENIIQYNNLKKNLSKNVVPQTPNNDESILNESYQTQTKNELLTDLGDDNFFKEMTKKIDFNQYENNYYNDPKPIIDDYQIPNEDEKVNYSYSVDQKEYLKSFYQNSISDISVYLKIQNNGKKNWTSNTKLCCDKNSQLKCDDIDLKPLEKDYSQTVVCKFNRLNELEYGKYTIFLNFVVDNIIYGEKIKIVLECLYNEKREKILQFKKMYDLNDSDYDEKTLIEILELNNGNFEATFNNLFSSEQDN